MTKIEELIRTMTEFLASPYLTTRSVFYFYGVDWIYLARCLVERCQASQCPGGWCRWVKVNQN